MGSVFDGAVEMLEAPVAEDRVLEKWLDYAKFVDADGVILFTMDETFKPKPVLGLHDVEIPVVVAGECNNSENKVCQVTSDKKLLAKLAVQEIEKNGWEKPCALVRNSFPLYFFVLKKVLKTGELSEEIPKTIPKIQKLSRKQTVAK